MAGNLDFGLLSQIKPDARVVGTGTSTHSDAGVGGTLSSLAGGLVEGMKAGASMKETNARTAQLQQSTSEQAQDFPNQLQRSKNATEESNMKVAGEKQAVQDQVDLRAAALKGPDEYAHILQQKSPEAYQDYKLKMAKTDKAFQDIAKQDADTDKVKLDNYNKAVGMAAQVTRSAAAGANPQMQQQIYQFGMSQLPKSVQAAMPPQYDPSQGMAVSRLAHEGQMDAIATKIETQGGKSDLIKNQTMRDYIQQQIDQKMQQGVKPDDPTVQELKQNRDELQKAIDNDPQLTGKSKDKNGNVDPNSVETLANKNAMTAQGKQNQGIEASMPLQDKLIEDTKLGMDILKKIPNDYTGPVSGRIGLGMENTDVQKLDKIINAIPLVQKSATLGQTVGARLFQSELEMMKKSSGSLNINAPALKWILQEQMQEAQITRFKNWNIEMSNYNNASPQVKDNWMSSHPKPEDPRIEVVSPEGKHMTIPYSQMDAYIKATPGAARW